MIIKFKYFTIDFIIIIFSTSSHILILFWIVSYFIIGFKTTCQ